MAANFYGVSAYQQTTVKTNGASGKATEKKNATAAEKSGMAKKTTGSNESVSVESEKVSTSNIETKAWSPISKNSSLVPSVKDGYGFTIGEVELSDGAKSYYDDLKKKFGNASFILVSKDMKAQVQANASAYGNASKMVVLIDEEKLERMATDESYRKKYEGIIAMAENQLATAKNSLASSGASVKNFGMSVNSDGTTEYFAALEKASDNQSKIMEKKRAEKQAQKNKDKKHADKVAKEKQLEKSKEKRLEQENRLENAKNKHAKSDVESVDDKEYIELHASSMEDLLNQVSTYAYNNSLNNIMTAEEKSVGQNFDFKG